MEKADITRRHFIGGVAAAGLAGCTTIDRSGIGGTSGLPARILFGACSAPTEESVGAFKEAGFDFFETDVASALMPAKDADTWRRHRDRLRKLPLPLRSCNGFLPGSFRLTGPAAAHEPVLAYAETACRRADELGLVTIVLGSGAARNAPEGFAKDKAVEQFTEFCCLLADRIADCRVCVALEPLCAKEANYLNLVTEGLEIVRAVNSPRIQQLADFYHMAEGHEGPKSIVKAGNALKHCHIATPGTRMAPGLDYEGPIPDYFQALYRIGYRGGVSIEAAWTPVKSREERIRLYRQARNLMFGRWAGQCYG